MTNNNNNSDSVQPIQQNNPYSHSLGRGKAGKMTQINWDEQTLPFRCYDCGHQSPTKDIAYEHSETCPGNQRNKRIS